MILESWRYPDSTQDNEGLMNYLYILQSFNIQYIICTNITQK